MSDERSHNKQYNKNHTIIIAAIIKLMRKFKVRITCAQIARETGLDRGTIRNHGADLNKLIDEAEMSLIGQFMYTIGRLSFNDEQRRRIRPVNETYFTSLMVYMSKRRRLFSLICEDDNNRQLLWKMMELLYEKLIINWFPKSEPIPAANSKPGRMYIAMATEILTEWGKEEGCRMNNSNDCLRRLLGLTEQASFYCKQ